MRRALLDADVNIEVADALIDGVKRRTLGEEILKGVTADQQFVKAMYDELLDMMGGDSASSESSPTVSGGDGVPAATLAVGTKEEPTVVLLAGLQGAGKTTAAGKLAMYLKEREVVYSAADTGEDGPLIASKLPKRERKVLLAAADVYRPAAIKQLEILGESINVEVFSLGTDADPVEIAAGALAKAKEEGFDTVLVDTAGRQAIDAELMDELKRIKTAGKSLNVESSIGYSCIIFRTGSGNILRLIISLSLSIYIYIYIYMYILSLFFGFKHSKSGRNASGC